MPKKSEAGAAEPPPPLENLQVWSEKIWPKTEPVAEWRNPAALLASLLREEWWTPTYLFVHGHQPRAIEPVGTDLTELARRLDGERLYQLLWGYYDFYLTAAEELGPELRGTVEPMFMFLLSALTYKLCALRGQLLAGLGRNEALWAEWPGYVPRDLSTTEVAASARWIQIMASLWNCLPFLSGSSGLRDFHRLLIPEPNGWLASNLFDAATLQLLETATANHLGFGQTVTFQEYEQILRDAFVNRRFALQVDEPVVVRLNDHPIVSEVRMMPKGLQKLIFRVDTHRHGQFLQTIDLQSGESTGLLPMAKQRAGLAHSFALEALLAEIYRASVTVVYERKPPPVQSLYSERLNLRKPRPDTIYWHYIPRSVYLGSTAAGRNGQGHRTLSRRPLEAGEQVVQEYARKVFRRIGHTRTLPEGWHPRVDPAEIYRDFGVRLRDGETWVKPHQAHWRASMSEDEQTLLRKIPHYVLRHKDQG